MINKDIFVFIFCLSGFQYKQLNQALCSTEFTKQQEAVSKVMQPFSLLCGKLTILKIKTTKTKILFSKGNYNS